MSLNWVGRYCWSLARIRPDCLQRFVCACYTQTATPDVEQPSSDVDLEATQSAEERDTEISQDETDLGSNESSSTTLTDHPKVLRAPSSHESPSFMHDPIAMKFVNCMMWDGKKSLSQRILKEALEVVKKLQLSKLKSSSAGEVVVVDPLVVFHQAVENAKPLLGTSSVKKGGKIYLVPHPLPPSRRQFLAIKWMIKAAREGKGKGMAKKLGAEILDAYNNQGTVLKRKQDLHRVAEANRAFAHFRW